MADRQTTTFHTYKFHQDVFRRIPRFPTQLTYSVQVPAFELRFFDRRKGLMGVLSSETQEQVVDDLTFDISGTGCGGLNFSTGRPPSSFTIRSGMRVDVHMFRDVKPWYSGLILIAPTQGNTDLRDTFEGHGFYDYLENIICRGAGTKPTAFQNTEIASIVVSLYQNFVVPNVPVEFNPSKVEVASYVVTNVNFEMATVKQAFEQLTGIAQDYEIGIDEARELFFRKVVTTPAYHFFYGKHLETLDISEDYSKMANRLYVKHDFTDPTSTTVHNVILAEDTDSQRRYGVRDKILTAPSVVNTTDASRWANYQLSQSRYPLRSAKLANIEVTTKVTVRGAARVFGLPDINNYSDEFGDWETQLALYSPNLQKWGLTLDNSGFMTVNTISTPLPVPAQLNFLSTGHVSWGLTLDNSGVLTANSISILEPPRTYYAVHSPNDQNWAVTMDDVGVLTTQAVATPSFTVNRAWTVEKNLKPDNLVYVGTVGLSKGQLAVSEQLWGSTKGASYHNIFVYKELTGDFIVETRIDSFTVSGGALAPSSWSSFGLHIRDNKKNWLTIGKTQLNTGGGGSERTFVSRWDTTSQVTNTIDNSWDISNPHYFKVQRVGNTFRAWSGTDGVSWVEFTNPSSPFVSDRPVEVGLLHADGNALPFTTSRFEYFRVTNLATVYSLQMKKVTYRWSGKSRSADVEVGDYDISLDQEFVNLSRKIKNQELLSEKV